MAYKESILFVGGDSSGKSTSLLEVAQYHPESKVIIFDFENKLSKIKDGLFPDLTNVTIVPIEDWSDVERGYELVERTLGVGDWFMVDGLDKAWDMAQATYDINNKSHGPDQWKYVKGIHNKEWLDKATGRAKFNVAATSWATPNGGFNIDRESDAEVKEDLMLWQQFGFKPGGEKRNTSRFDTVFALKTKINPVGFQVATYKDKVRPYLSGGAKSLWLDFKWPFWPIYVKAVKDSIERGERTIDID